MLSLTEGAPALAAGAVEAGAGGGPASPVPPRAGRRPETTMAAAAPRPSARVGLHLARRGDGRPLAIGVGEQVRAGGIDSSGGDMVPARVHPKPSIPKLPSARGAHAWGATRREPTRGSTP